MIYLVATTLIAFQQSPVASGRVIRKDETETGILGRAHSHNDYTRRRPLFDALDHRFGSVEADVYLIKGKLLVGHDLADLSEKKTIESLYLAPLAKRIRENQGFVYKGIKETFWVLVDIKRDGLQAYRAFKDSVANYPELKYQGPGSAVRFVISGDRPIAEIVKDKGLIAGVDGRIGDLGKNYPTEIMPWISQPWSAHFKESLRSDCLNPYFAEVAKVVKRINDEGKQARFWGSPDEPVDWFCQYIGGANWINTDKLAEYRKLLLNRFGQRP